MSILRSNRHEQRRVRGLPQRSITTASQLPRNVDVNCDEWIKDIKNESSKDECNKFILNFLAQNCLNEIHQAFSKDADIATEDGEIKGIMLKIGKIRESVQQGDISNARRDAIRYFPSLLHHDSHFMHLFMIQELVEIAKKGDINETIEYTHKYLSRCCEIDSGLMEIIKSVLMLLLVSEPSDAPEMVELVDLADVGKRSSLITYMVDRIFDYFLLERKNELVDVFSSLSHVQDILMTKKVKFPLLKDVFTAEIVVPER